MLSLKNKKLIATYPCTIIILRIGIRGVIRPKWSKCQLIQLAVSWQIHLAGGIRAVRINRVGVNILVRIV